MKAYWDILRELREDHDLTQAQVAAVISRFITATKKGSTSCRCITCKHYALITMSALTIFLACRRDCAGRAEGLFFYAATAGC